MGQFDISPRFLWGVRGPRVRQVGFQHVHLYSTVHWRSVNFAAIAVRVRGSVFASGSALFLGLFRVFFADDFVGNPDA